MLESMKRDEPANPSDVCSFGPATEMTRPDGRANLVEQPETRTTVALHIHAEWGLRILCQAALTPEWGSTARHSAETSMVPCVDTVPDVRSRDIRHDLVENHRARWVGLVRSTLGS
jgi:hypothetical protein